MLSLSQREPKLKSLSMQTMYWAGVQKYVRGGLREGEANTADRRARPHLTHSLVPATNA